MEFLLGSEEEVPAGEASRTLGALERLLLGMGTLMTLQMLEPGKRSIAGPADVRPRFVSLGGREGAGCLGAADSGDYAGQRVRIEAIWRPAQRERYHGRSIPFSELLIPPLAVEGWDDVAAGMARDCC